MAKQKDIPEEEPVEEPVVETTEPEVGPEASGQQNAATLAEAMELQNRLATEAAGTTEEAEPETESEG